MDPISAFGLAVNILTVIDLSVKVISTASEIRSYGESITTSDRAAVAQHFESRCERLIESSKATPEHSNESIHGVIPTEDDMALRKLAEEAKAIARDIQRGLVRRQKGQALLKTLYDAVLSVWGELEMKEKTDRLKEMRAEIQFGLMVSIKGSVDAAGLRWNDMLQRVDDSKQHIIGTLLSDNDTIRSDMERRVEELNQEVVSHFDQASHLASQRHDELLNAIAGGSGLATSAVSETTVQITERILGKLWFTTINDRYEDILPAHKETFEWIFSRDLRLHSSSNFIEWIENGTGVYWMSGRAGSGKSTLMKYMADNSRMEMLLRTWARGQPLVTAKYLFWDLSSDILQKSLDGLFRGILYEIIRGETSFAPLLFPDQFKQANGWSRPFPTSNELKRAFERLISLESSPTQVALLIDGLDEFSAPRGAQHDLAETLKRASCSKHMKIIASSRPETVFEGAFKDCEKLYLHDLSRRDQTLFVTDKLYEHQRTSYLVKIPGGQTEVDDLIESTVKRSEGIFLWLRLVVEALVLELDVCESIGDLESILLQFPRGLEKLFLHMMRRMLKENERRGFECLWLMHRSTGMRYKQSPYQFREQEPYWSRKRNSLDTDFNYSFKLTALCMDGAQMQLETVLNTSIGPLSSLAFEDTVKKVENRLRSWCAGLLELSSPPSSLGVTLRRESYDPEVSFIHRSVAEFLELPSTFSELATDLVETSFDVDILLMKGLLIKLKREAIYWDFGGTSKIWYFVELIMRLAAFVSVGREAEMCSLLAELDRSMTSLVETLRRYPDCKPTYRTLHLFGADHWANYFPWELRSTPRAAGDNLLILERQRIRTSTTRSAGFLSIAIENGLATFVMDVLNKPETLLLLKTARGVPLLSSACSPPPFSIAIPGTIRPAIIQRLLDLGANPNQIYKDALGRESTPWGDLLYSFKYLEITTVEGARQFAEILTAMIKNGADQHVGTQPEIITQGDDTDSSVSIEAALSDVQSEDPTDFEEEEGPPTVRGVIYQSFGIKSSFLKTHHHKYTLGNFVPFEEIDSTWEIRDEKWGDRYGAMYPDNCHPPKLTSSEKESIQAMGLVLLKLLDQKESPQNADSEAVHSVSLKNAEPEAVQSVSLKNAEPEAVQSISAEQPRISKLGKLPTMKTELLARFRRNKK